MATSTPNLVIRQHDPGRQRRQRGLLALAWLGSLLIVAALVASFAARAPQREELARLGAAAKEGETLKTRIAVLERSEQVAKAALVDLQGTLRDREEEIAGVRADLAFYGRLVGGAKREGLAVHALSLKPVAGSRAWNFSATLTQNFKRGPETRGKLTLSVSGIRDGKLETLSWSDLGQPAESSGIEYAFKYFEQINGTILLPEGFEPNRVQASADGDGGHGDQEFSWVDAAKAEETDNVRQ